MTEVPRPPRGAVPDPPAPPGVDPTKPGPARLYDYYLGGHNNFEADRRAAEALRQSLPALSDAAWASRGFHQRAAAWLAGQAGLRQFIDIGSGLPTVGNTHQVVQWAGPARQGRRRPVLQRHGNGAALPKGHRWPHVRRAVGSGGSRLGRQ